MVEAENRVQNVEKMWKNVQTALEKKKVAYKEFVNSRTTYNNYDLKVKVQP